MSYLIRRVLANPRLILDEMCRLYGKFASYLRRVLCKTRLIFPRINGPNVDHDINKIFQDRLYDILKVILETFNLPVKVTSRAAKSYSRSSVIKSIT